MDKKEILDLVSKDDKISALPQVLSKVLEIIGNETASVDDLAKVIGQDAALTARILKAANAPLYKRTRQIGTINAAVSLLGFRTVQSLALSVSVYDLLNDDSTNSIPLEKFWKHSLEVAILSRMLAKKGGYPVAEEAMVAGLLHDAGILVLHRVIPDEYCKVLEKPLNGKMLADYESELLGCTHADIIGFLAQKWNLPDIITHAAANHHKPVKIDSIENTSLDAYLYVAEKLSAHQLEESYARLFDNRIESSRIVQALGIEDDILSLSALQLYEVVNTAQCLEIDIGSPFELVSSANEQLFEVFKVLDDLMRKQLIGQKQLIKDERRKTAFSSLKIILATLSHYVNNATASILGRAQLLELALQRGDLIDRKELALKSLEVIQKSVANITAVLEELKVLQDFDTVPYYENSRIIDIEENVRKRTKQLQNNNSGYS